MIYFAIILEPQNVYTIDNYHISFPYTKSMRLKNNSLVKINKLWYSFKIFKCKVINMSTLKNIIILMFRNKDFLAVETSFLYLFFIDFFKFFIFVKVKKF